MVFKITMSEIKTAIILPNVAISYGFPCGCGYVFGHTPISPVVTSLQILSKTEMGVITSSSSSLSPLGALGHSKYSSVLTLAPSLHSPGPDLQTSPSSGIPVILSFPT